MIPLSTIGLAAKSYRNIDLVDVWCMQRCKSFPALMTRGQDDPIRCVVTAIEPPTTLIVMRDDVYMEHSWIMTNEIKALIDSIMF